LGEIDTKSYMKGDYEEFQALRRQKNKPNSKPNKANMPAYGRKFEARSSKSETRRKVLNDKAQSTFHGAPFEKTNPISKGAK